METTKTALSIAQLQVSETQANTQWWTATLFAAVGFALGLQGLLDREAIGKLLALVSALEPLSGNFVVKLGIHMGILLLSLGLAALVVIVVNRQRFKRRTRERR